MLALMIREEKKWQKENRTPVIEAWNVLGFGITLSHMHTVRKHTEGVFLPDSWEVAKVLGFAFS